METFGSGSPDPLSNILRIKIRIRTEVIMSTFFFIAFEIQAGSTDKISMNINQEIFESEFDFDQINSIKPSFILVKFISISVESIFISIESFFISTQINFFTVEIISTPTKAKTFIELTNAFTPINISKNPKFLFFKFVKDNVMASSIKKQKSSEMKKILLFSSDLSQQKTKQAMQQVKVALTTAYFFAENADILITIDFINQIIDGKSKIFEKAQFSNINDKLDQILKKINSSNFHEQFFKGKKCQAKTAILLFTTAIVKPLLQKFKSKHFIFLPPLFMIKSIKKVNLTLFFKST